jgi:cellulose synthase/poly-beta-1,6-N-acetylglucosamine synthase-like glycosyltransferase
LVLRLKVVERMLGRGALSVCRGLAQVISGLTCAVLLAFSVRRALFTVAMFRRDPGRLTPPRSLPTVLVLVACRDEANLIDEQARQVDRIEYPADRLQVVLIDDGSRDATSAHMRRAADARPGWHVLRLERSVGKAAALNTALQQYTFGEVIYVLDADHWPEPSAVKNLVRYLDDPRVGGVSGQMVSRNALASVIAYYSSVEGLVHQLLTMRAKDRLGLAPALLGANCGYRRAALHACGLFRAGAQSEDYDLTLAFYQAGYGTRFGQDVVSTHDVPETVRGYLNQHVRWNRGIYDVAQHRARMLLGNGELPPALRVELALFMAGYLDRVALLAAAGLSAVGALRADLVSFPRTVFLLALVSPFAQIVALFVEQRAPAAMWLRLPLIPLLFGLDVLAAIEALAGAVTGRRSAWGRTERRAQRQ